MLASNMFAICIHYVAKITISGCIAQLLPAIKKADPLLRLLFQ
jgi:hypothetical protein